MKLIDAPIGIFRFDGELVLKTEYHSENKLSGKYIPDCYIVRTGEYFWGGAKTANELNNLDVEPVDFAELLPTVTDTISKQAAISAICNACGKIDCDQVDKCEKLFTTQEAAVKQGEIRPGDEVERCVDGRYDGRAMFLAEDNDRWTCLFWTGCGYTTLSYPKSQFKRTGRHHNIEPILEGIRNES